MYAILKNEIARTYHSMSGYVCNAFFILTAGIFFTSFHLILGYNEFGYTLSSTKMVLMILAPILTMGTFSEERKRKTDQFLFTAPVSIPEIVWGKYLAVMTVFTIPLLFLGFCPLIMSRFGYVNWARTAGCFLAYWLLGSSCCAVGLLISVLTTAPILSAVLTFAVLLCSYLADTLCALTVSVPVLPGLIRMLALFARYSDFVDGLFDLTHLVYYGCVTVTVLCLAILILERRRWK